MFRRREATDGPQSPDARVRRVAELAGAEAGGDGSSAAERIYRHAAQNSTPYRAAPVAAAASTIPLRTHDDARELRDFVVSDLLADGSDTEAIRSWSQVRIDRGAKRRLRGPATDFEPMDLGGLREYIRDRTVAVVADGAGLAGSGLGARIDACDIVIRFDAFAAGGPDTGSRTDVHVTANVNPQNWDVPVTLRIVMSGSVRTWRSGIIVHLIPTAQRFVGTEALRWPLYSPTVLGEPKTGHESSLMFQTIRLLDFLGVAESLEVFGFPAAEQGGPFPIEHAWLAARAGKAEPGVLSLGRGPARREPA